MRTAGKRKQGGTDTKSRERVRFEARESETGCEMAKKRQRLGGYSSTHEVERVLRGLDRQLLGVQQPQILPHAIVVVAELDLDHRLGCGQGGAAQGDEEAGDKDENGHHVNRS